jgi:Mg-chelatase subunit ChlD
MSISPWAQRRKLLYTSVVVGILVVVGGFQAFRMLYEPPTCFDGRRNGGETGIDCGGNCERICAADVRPLSVLWTQMFEIREGEYSAVAYVENPNRGAGIERLQYTFRFTDEQGAVVREISGVTFAEPNNRFPIFEGPIRLAERPANVRITFDPDTFFIRSPDEDIPLFVENTTLLASETNPRISALVRNASIRPMSNVQVYAVVYDRPNVPIAASRTVVEFLPANTERRITFTWPSPFRIEPGVCAQPVSVVLAIDRSGSMNDDGGDPPQPITDTLEAAAAFVSKLGEEDKIGVVSFATNASDLPDFDLSSDISAAEAAVKNIRIKPEDERGFTNPGDALLAARRALIADPLFRVGTREHIIVLLTDGHANFPRDPGGEEHAEHEAKLTKREGIKIYTIGLGANINREFLARVATAPEYYFEAATTADLRGIYEEISTAVCHRGPSVIELIPRHNTLNVSPNR